MAENAKAKAVTSENHRQRQRDRAKQMQEEMDELYGKVDPEMRKRFTPKR